MALLKTGEGVPRRYKLFPVVALIIAAVLSVTLPFGGVKQTGNGHREGGWEVYDFYSETKVAYIDYSGRLQRAQIDVTW